MNDYSKFGLIQASLFNLEPDELERLQTLCIEHSQTLASMSVEMMLVDHRIAKIKLDIDGFCRLYLIDSRGSNTFTVISAYSLVDTPTQAQPCQIDILEVYGIDTSQLAVLSGFLPRVYFSGLANYIPVYDPQTKKVYFGPALGNPMVIKETSTGLHRLSETTLSKVQIESIIAQFFIAMHHVVRNEIAFDFEIDRLRLLQTDYEDRLKANLSTDYMVAPVHAYQSVNQETTFSMVKIQMHGLMVRAPNIYRGTEKAGDRFFDFETPIIKTRELVKFLIRKLPRSQTNFLQLIRRELESIDTGNQDPDDPDSQNRNLFLPLELLQKLQLSVVSFEGDFKPINPLAWNISNPWIEIITMLIQPSPETESRLQRTLNELVLKLQAKLPSKSSEEPSSTALVAIRDVAILLQRVRWFNSVRLLSPEEAKSANQLVGMLQNSIPILDRWICLGLKPDLNRLTEFQDEFLRSYSRLRLT